MQKKELGKAECAVCVSVGGIPRATEIVKEREEGIRQDKNHLTEGKFSSGYKRTVCHWREEKTGRNQGAVK